MEREIPLYTLEGVKDAEVTTHYISTGDQLGISALRFQRGEATEAVLLVHGLTTSSDMFIMPEHYNLVSYLLDHGFGDVWCLDYRMSNRHPYNLFKHRYTMDDVALFDFPPTLDLMRQHIGSKPIHVISHCLGANSFAIGLFGKVIQGVSSVILNSVALTPRVPGWTKVKLAIAPDMIEYVLGFPYMNPAWSEDPGLTRGRIVSKLVDLVHRECDVPACHMLSLMWGTGWPALYSHDNMADVTHRRGGDLYGATSLHYHRHVRKQVRAGRAVDTLTRVQELCQGHRLRDAVVIQQPDPVGAGHVRGLDRLVEPAGSTPVLGERDHVNLGEVVGEHLERPIARLVVNDDDLINGPRLLHHSSERPTQEVAAIPRQDARNDLRARQRWDYATGAADLPRLASKAWTIRSPAARLTGSVAQQTSVPPQRRLISLMSGLRASHPHFSRQYASWWRRRAHCSFV